MIDRKSDYKYVLFPEEYFHVTGHPISRRSSGNQILRGEDLSFLRECLVSRKLIAEGMPSDDYRQTAYNVQKNGVDSLFNVVKSYGWVEPSANLPNDLNRSGTHALDVRSFLSDEGLVVDEPENVMFTGLNEAQLRAVYDHIPKMKRLIMGGGSHTDFRKRWTTLLGETEYYGSQIVPFEPGPEEIINIEKIGYYDYDNRSWVIDNGHKYEATRADRDYGTENFMSWEWNLDYGDYRGVYARVTPYFGFHTYYLRACDGQTTSYNRNALVKGPDANLYTYLGPMSIPVSELKSYWQSTVGTEFNFDTDLPSSEPEHQGGFDLQFNVTATIAALIVEFDDRITVI